MKQSKETLSRLAYLAGITVTMMGIVIECIFMYTIGYPYWMERDMVQTRCVTQRRELVEWAMPCQTSEKGRPGQFPCYRVLVAYIDQSMEVSQVTSAKQFNMTIKPARSAIWLRQPSERNDKQLFDWTQRVKYGILYQSYFEWKEAKLERYECALSPCNMSTKQNEAQVMGFMKRYGLTTGYEYDCYQSDSFDKNSLLVNLITTEVPSLPHLLSWPLIFAVIGIVTLVINGCLFGCSVWKDAILV